MRGRTCLRDSRASAAAEMALVLPLIAFIILNVVDLGIYIYTKMQVDLAAQEAAGAARVLCDTAAELPATINCSAVNATMLSAAQTTSLGSSVSLGAPTEAWYCANSSAVLMQVAAIGGAVPANCSGIVATSTAKPGEYLAITASYTYTPVFPPASVVAVLPAAVQSTAWMRLQ